jgi:anti-sigma factor RsiW
MANEQRRQQMQHALDGVLSPQEKVDLARHIERDPEDAGYFDKLQRVDALLRAAPHERAPQRLALTIMARIGETVRQQQAQQLQADYDPELYEAALQVAMQMVTVATLPLMIGASYLLLNAAADPSVLDPVLQEVAALMILVIDVMKVMLEEAQETYAEDPEAALALLALIPVTLLELVKQVLGYGDDEDGEE